MAESSCEACWCEAWKEREKRREAKGIIIVITCLNLEVANHLFCSISMVQPTHRLPLSRQCSSSHVRGQLGLVMSTQWRMELVAASAVMYGGVFRSSLTVGKSFGI